MRKDKLPIEEELNFHYLLQLLLPLRMEEGFALLPELFSILGHEKLIELCKYAGGETIKIPNLDELTTQIESLEWFYRVYISKKSEVSEVPYNYIEQVERIRAIYAEESETHDKREVRR